MRWFVPLVLVLIAITPLLAFFHQGLPQGHDAQDHVVRIANFYKALSEGVLVPRWAGNLNWGYGHPVLMFLYPFSSYCASFFHFLGFSFVDATKAVFVFAYIASILSMYLWVSAAWGKRAGVIGALLYGFAPYRFVDMYVRMAIGEHMAFVFPPLICYFLYKLAINTHRSLTKNQQSTRNQELRTRNYFYSLGLSLSFALLILSHNALALMFLPIIGFYSIYLFFIEAKKSLYFMLYTLYSLFLGFGLSAFFWVPAFFEGKFTLRNIVTAGEAVERFVPWTWFFYSPWNYGGGDIITKSLGFFQWIGVIASLIVVWKTKEKKVKILLSAFLFLLIISLFMMTSWSKPVWAAIIMLQNFQFPWRFLSLTTFIAAAIGGISISYVINTANKLATPACRQAWRNSHLSNILFIVFCLLSIFATVHMWRPKDYQREDESFYTRIYPGTTDTGESSPIWTTRFMEQSPKAVVEVISGEAMVKQVSRTTTVHEYQVSAKTRAELLENTIYFPGWEVLVDGKKTDIEFQSGIHRGIMTFWVEKGERRVTVVFRDTKLRKISNVITVISGIVLILACLIVGFIWKRKK